MIREKKTKSGPLLEVDFFPVFENGRCIPGRPKGEKRSTKEQEKYNRRQAEKKVIRKVSANFDNTDYFTHPTCDPEFAPHDEKCARKIFTNYLRRIKNKRVSNLKKIKSEIKEIENIIHSLNKNSVLIQTLDKLKQQQKKLSEPFRYIYVIEKKTYRTGEYKGLNNWHYHSFITGGLSAKEMEELWKHGRINVNRFKPDTFGPEAAAKYICKDPKGSKSFVCSKNLKKPNTPPSKDGKTSARQVEKFAKERIDDREYWERKYKGYRFLRCYARLNPFNGRWYVSVVMYKTDGDPPQWNIDEWLEE